MIRHGQTDYNLKGIVQGGGIDSSINEFGKKQAACFYEAYHHIPFDKVYTSTLKRTLESVEQFLSDGLPHEKLSGLNEISWGDREGQVITEEEDAYYHSVIEEWQKGKTDLRIRGGESPRDVTERQKIALEHIMSQENEETILICMHGRAMRILLCLLLNYPLKSMDLFEHTNLCLYKITFTGSMFTVDASNDVSHMESIMSIRQ